MEALLKSELGYSTVKSTGLGGGGCINSGSVYDTDKGKIYVKENPKSGAKLMFDGEMAGLNAIVETQTARVPKPAKVFERNQGAMLVMEYLDMRHLSRHAKELGTKMAELHRANQQNEKEAKESQSYVGKEAPNFVSEFGFDVTTCCGFLPLVNEWCKDWVEFYARNRLKSQLDMVQKKYHDQEARSLWPEVERNLPKLFPASVKIQPALLHGDLWGGNVAELADEPCIFDPASFYGHSEFEFGIASMFGGFSGSFFSAYHAILPKEEGFEKRQNAYKLFHYLNHWNHFGSGYRGTSISLMKSIAKL